MKSLPEASLWFLLGANVLNVLVLSHLGRRVPRGAATTPKPGVQHELNKSGVRWQDCKTRR